MRKSILLFLTTMLLFCCHGHGSEDHNYPADVPAESPLENIFKSRAIQDTLENFMRVVDSLPHNWINLNIVYSVFLNRTASDTLLSLAAYPYVLFDELIDHNSSKFNIIKTSYLGAAQDGIKVVAILYHDIDTPDVFINSEKLDMQTFVENTRQYLSSLHSNISLDYAYSRLSFREYRVTSCENIQLIGLRKSSVERERFAREKQIRETPDLDSAILSASIRDTLKAFMQAHPSVVNPYSNETVYTVTITQDNSDTLVALTAGAYVANDFGEKSRNHITAYNGGGYQLENTLIAVNGSFTGDGLQGLIRRQFLDMGVYARHTIMYYDILNRCQDTDIRVCQIARKYRYADGNLSFVEEFCDSTKVSDLRHYWR